ncbi:MAG: phospholipid carrier-dependent glycosyltransferase [Candidatus Omnitrophota bacterium]|nr:phospholipid carrier-dependent glycosyltransferase [Candidatus Omnitrophota bacterium]
MMELLIFIIIIFIALGLGSLLLCALYNNRREEIGFYRAFTIPLGLAALSYTTYLIGSLGILYKPVIIAVLFLFFIFSLFGLTLHLPLHIKDAFPKGKLNRVIFIVITMFMLITLAGAISPEIGTDSLCYHLGIPKQFILQHRIGFIPYTMNSLYPFFMEMLFTLGIILKGAILAKLFHWFCGILLVVAVYLFTKKIANIKCAFIAGLLVISSPGIFNEMVYAYIDVGLSLYVSLAVFSLILWIEREKNSCSYLFFSGLFLGFALSIKYLAFYALFPLIAVLFWELRKKRKEIGVIKPVLYFFLPCIGVSFFWYLKSYLVLGNPFFPAFNEFFDTPIKFDIKRHLEMGLGKSILSFFLLPWNLARYPEIFGGRGSQVGVQYLLLLPFIYFGFISRQRWFRKLLFIALGYTLIWFFLAQRDRFLFPVLPLYVVLIAYSIYALYAQKKYIFFLKLSFMLISLTTLFNFGICAYHNRHNYKVALGLESKEAYLSRWVTNYKMVEYVNKNLPLDATILLINDIKIYYFDRWVVRENIFEMWKLYRQKYTDSKELIQYLKNQGFTHICYKQTVGEDVPAYLQLILNIKIPIYHYGPVLNIETRQKEEFFLYKL